MSFTQAKLEILLPPLKWFNRINSPFISPSLIKISESILHSYPMTLLSRDFTGKAHFLGFMASYVYYDRLKTKILRLTNPIIFDKSRTHLIIEKILEEVTELAISLNCKKINTCVSIFPPEEKYLYPPYSLDLFGDRPCPELGSILIENDFVEIEKSQEIKIPLFKTDEISIPSNDSDSNCEFYTISDSVERLKKYYLLCQSDQSFPEYISNTTVYQEIETLGDRTYKKEEFIQFFNYENTQGCFYWNPISLYEAKYRPTTVKILRILFSNENSSSRNLLSVISNIFSFFKHNKYEEVLLILSESQLAEINKFPYESIRTIKNYTKYLS